MTLERLGPGVLRGALLALWAYLDVVFVFRERVAGMPIGAPGAVLVFAVGAAAILFALSRQAVTRVLPASRMLDVGFTTLALLLAIFLADLVFGIRGNLLRQRAEAPYDTEARLGDRHLWHGELFPRYYYPTRKNFVLYKPNVRLSAETFGDYYDPAMLASHTLVDSVLEPRRITYTIGPHGLRETAPLAGARIFALGDSYAMGFGTDEAKTWTHLLGAALGEPVYNLGISNTGPGKQLDMLRYLLDTNRDSMQVRDLLWMIYEGNDLENSYAKERARPAQRSSGLGALLRGSVLEAVGSLPGRVKAQSVLRQVVRGELHFGPTRGRAEEAGRHEIDGVRLPTPLFHSPRWGYMLFHPDDVNRATRPRDYVWNHPNRPRLDQVLRDMRRLADQHGFRVSVIIAPSAARMYGAAFEGFPALSDRPYFVDYVAERAAQEGFRVVNLLTLMRPFADAELLYYRDDHHWNERGNAVAAQLIREALTPTH